MVGLRAILIAKVIMSFSNKLICCLTLTLSVTKLRPAAFFCFHAERVRKSNLEPLLKRHSLLD